MKSIELVGKYYFYSKVSRLSRSDYSKFHNLLKGGDYNNDVLYILPVDLSSIYCCRGFAIEHHQLFLSGDKKGDNDDGTYYLVFRAIPIRSKYDAILYYYSYYALDECNKEQLLNGTASSPYIGLKRLYQPSYDNVNNPKVWRELVLPE